MRSSRSVLCSVALLLVTIASVAESSVIVVGGATGWTTGFNYDAWAVAQNIQPRVGDSLVFVNHDNLTHTVAMLNSADDYQRCVLGGATTITPVPSGKNLTMVIPASLEDQTIYLVCTISGHCVDNQKIMGTVLAALSSGSPPTSPPTSPATSPATSPTSNDADMNRLICWTTAILLIAACLWNLG